MDEMHKFFVDMKANAVMFHSYVRILYMWSHILKESDERGWFSDATFSDIVLKNKYDDFYLDIATYLSNMQGFDTVNAKNVKELLENDKKLKAVSRWKINRLKSGDRALSTPGSSNWAGDPPVPIVFDESGATRAEIGRLVHSVIGVGETGTMISVSRKIHRETQEQNEQLKSELFRTRTQFEAFQQEAYEAEERLETLQDENIRIKKELREKQEQGEENSASREQIEELEQERQKNEQALETLRNKLLEETKSAQEWESEFYSLVDRSLKASEKNNKEIEEKENTIIALNKESEEKGEQLKARVLMLEKKEAALEEKNEQLRSELEEKNATIDKQDLELNEFLELNEENERLIDTKDQNIDSLEYQQAILVKKLDVSLDEQLKYQKQAVRDVGEKDGLEKELDVARQSQIKLEEELKDVNSEIDRLTKKCNSQNSGFTQYSISLGECLDRKENLIQEIQEQNDDLARRLEQSEQDNDSSKQRHSELQQKHNELRDTYDDQTKELRNVRDDHSKLDRQNRELQRNLETKENFEASLSKLGEILDCELTNDEGVGDCMKLAVQTADRLGLADKENLLGHLLDFVEVAKGATAAGTVLFKKDPEASSMPPEREIIMELMKYEHLNVHDDLEMVYGNGALEKMTVKDFLKTEARELQSRKKSYSLMRGLGLLYVMSSAVFQEFESRLLAGLSGTGKISMKNPSDRDRVLAPLPKLTRGLYSLTGILKMSLERVARTSGMDQLANLISREMNEWTQDRTYKITLDENGNRVKHEPEDFNRQLFQDPFTNKTLTETLFKEAPSLLSSLNPFSKTPKYKDRYDLLEEAGAKGGIMNQEAVEASFEIGDGGFAWVGYGGCRACECPDGECEC